MIKLIFKIFMLLSLLGAPLVAVEMPAKPTGLSYRMVDGQPMLAWDPVAGALLYRVAVFGPMEAKKAGPLQAAVWVDVVRWHYGQDPYIPKAGNWISTLPKQLQAGKKYKWIVSAAIHGEKDKGLSAGDIFTMPLAKQRHEGLLLEKASVHVSPTPTSTPVAVLSATASPTATATPAVSDGEFTEGDDLDTEIDFGEGEAPEETKRIDPSLARAKALFGDKKYKQAQVEYQKLIDANKSNADAWEGLGDSYKASRLKLEAVEAYEEAVRLDSSKKYLKAWIRKQRRW